jgi:hypothetical protein
MSREPLAVLPMGATGVSLGKKSLVKLHWFGKLLIDHRYEVAQLRFVTAINANHKDGVLRVPTKLPGTITMRSSSGDIE